MKSTIKKIEQVSETLREALNGPREEYRNLYRAHLAKQVDEVKAKLEANGMDMEKTFPYPNGNMGRAAYIVAQDAWNFAKMFFKSTTSHGFRQPDPVVAIPSNEKSRKLDKLADEATARHFDGYIIKLANKIGKPIVSAKLVGSLWHDCTLHVICEDFEPQCWHTQCIWNVSCLGRVFNQWPTRRKS